METEIKDATGHRLNVEDAEINVLYTTAYAIFLIAQDAERRMNAENKSLGGKRKMLFKGIISDLRGAKNKQEQLSEDYIKAWGSTSKNHAEEQLNANALARLLMLWFDRIEGYEQYENAVEEFIKKFPQDVITDEALQCFYVKTWNGQS